MANNALTKIDIQRLNINSITDEEYTGSCPPVLMHVTLLII